MNGLTFLERRRGFPYIRIFERFIIGLVAHISTGFASVGTKASIGGSEVAVGDSEGTVLDVDGFVGEGWERLFVTIIDSRVVGIVHSAKHIFQGLGSFFLLDSLGLKTSPIF